LIFRFYNRFLSGNQDLVSFIKGITGVVPSKIILYQQVFRHRSKFHEPEKNNERLELLGDSILDAIVCEYLYKKYPYRDEGFITSLRSKVVNRKQLNEIGEKLGLLKKLEYHKRSIGEAGKDLAGNTFEALVGAVYLDAGFDKTRQFIQKRILTNMLDLEGIDATETDYKSKLYHYSQRENKPLDFRVHEQGTRNRRSYFVIHLYIDGEQVAVGEGYNKKAAEQSAALNAMNVLGLN
jgi:ribonuclease-3